MCQLLNVQTAWPDDCSSKVKHRIEVLTLFLFGNFLRKYLPEEASTILKI